MILKFTMILMLAATASQLVTRSARAAETMTFERVVPPGATLTYSEGGQPLKTLTVPPGRVTVVVTYGGSVTPRHERKLR